MILLAQELLSLLGSPWNESLSRGLSNTGHRSERSLAERSLYVFGILPVHRGALVILCWGCPRRSRMYVKKSRQQRHCFHRIYIRHGVRVHAHRAGPHRESEDPGCPCVLAVQKLLAEEKLLKRVGE